MSDFKNLMVALVPEEAAMRPIGETLFDDAMSETLSAAHEAGRMRHFATNSYDHLLFLDDFLAAYGLPQTAALKRDQRGDDGAFLAMGPAQRRTYAAVLGDFAAKIETDPEPVASVVRQQDADSLASHGRLLSPTDTDFFVGKRREAIALWQAEIKAAPIDGARMLALWRANPGTGYFPDDYPPAAVELFTARPSNLLACAFQTFGYFKAMREWSQEEPDFGSLELIW